MGFSLDFQPFIRIQSLYRPNPQTCGAHRSPVHVSLLTLRLCSSLQILSSFPGVQVCSDHRDCHRSHWRKKHLVTSAKETEGRETARNDQTKYYSL
jgi:hypothetical protein